MLGGDVFEERLFRRAGVIGALIAVVWIAWSNTRNPLPASQVAQPLPAVESR